MPPSDVATTGGEVGWWGAEIVTSRVGTREARAFVPRPPSLVAVLAEAGDRWADRIFLVQGHRRLSFADVVRRSAAAAVELAGAGVAPGDRVAVLAGNGPEWVLAFFGVLQAGGVAVLVNRWWTDADLGHALAVTDTRVAVVDGARRDRVPAGITTVATETFADADARTVEPPVLPNEANEAYVIFTSGTTARPKAALFTHRAAVANLHNVLERSQQLPPYPADAPTGVSLCSLPLFHMSGIQVLLQNLVTGGRLVFTEGRFDAAAALDLIERERVTNWAVVPTMLALVLDDPDLATRDLASVRSLAVGGADVKPQLLERAHDAFPGARRRIAHSYGSTEAGGTVATGLRRDDGERLAVPLATVEVRIDRAGADGVGEIVVRSPAAMEGYLGVPAADQPIGADGWLRTGDLGRMVEGGLLEVRGRENDVIIRGGENIAPEAVEQALLQHPDVADAVVVGIAHDTWGEEVGARVRPRPGMAPTPDELAGFVAPRLARFAVPTRWWITDEPVPLTDTGKVAKPAVREAFPAG